MNVNAGECSCVDGSDCLGLMASRLTLVFFMMKLKFSNKLFLQVLVGNPWSLVTRSFCPSSWSDLHFRSEQAVIITS